MMDNLKDDDGKKKEKRGPLLKVMEMQDTWAARCYITGTDRLSHIPSRRR